MPRVFFLLASISTLCGIGKLSIHLFYFSVCGFLMNSFVDITVEDENYIASLTLPYWHDC